ncbi:MAG TPA: DNA-binding protein, partial [Deltaproteobacteria bacterium]|nr:DNA-binding protein [Deltaproteobacteria bacterium]
MRKPDNDEIAALLERVADLLEAQHASIYRVRAYRTAAETVRSLPAPIADRIGKEEPDGLESLPGIGKSIAAAIREIVRTGRLRQLERLEGEASPQELFATIPGIGESLAHRIESQLHIESLEDLEVAAHDGRLETVPGMGPRRVRSVRESLENRLRFSTGRRIGAAPPGGEPRDRPPVRVLLEMDRLYRTLSDQGRLRRIAPRRFNPEGRAWLPILHREIDGWSLTAMHSNTARAHQLGRTRDWVVIYYERDGVEGQCTVVTEHSGPLAGRRVVRGRESECGRYYALESSGESVPEASSSEAE